MGSLISFLNRNSNNSIKAFEQKASMKTRNYFNKYLYCFKNVMSITNSEYL